MLAQSICIEVARGSPQPPAETVAVSAANNGLTGRSGARRRTANATHDRTLPQHVPRKHVGTSRYPLVRWWQIAHDHLWRMVMDPATVWQDANSRGVDMQDHCGFRIDQRTGAVTVYALVRRGRYLYREHGIYQGCLLFGAKAQRGFLVWVILAHAESWARLAGMPLAQVNRQVQRLKVVMEERWIADGMLQRMWRVKEQVLALDADVVRLVRATIQCETGPDAVYLGDYNRCLADRANLLTIEREAPQLLRLYSLLLPEGAGLAEPKQALKRAFLAGGQRSPRLWRTMHRFDAVTIDALTAHGQCFEMNPLADWIDLLQTLDLPVRPPVGWLFALRGLHGYAAVSRVYATPWAAGLLAAHLRAWMDACDEAAREDLFDKLEGTLFLLLNLPAAALPPAVTGGWKWWLRWALSAQAAQFHSELEAARHWDALTGLSRAPVPAPLYAGDIQLWRLTTSVSLLEEGRAMSHCVHAWRDHLVASTAAIFSVRRTDTNEHLGTAAIQPAGAIDLYGQSNRPLRPEDAQDVEDLLRRESPNFWPKGQPDWAGDDLMHAREDGRLQEVTLTLNAD